MLIIERMKNPCSIHVQRVQNGPRAPQTVRRHRDIHTSIHVKEIKTQMRNSALMLYFRSFACRPLREMERNTVLWHLIYSKSIKVRMDHHNKLCL